MTNTIIRVENLSKSYNLYEKNIDRLKEAINFFNRKYHTEFFSLKNLNFSIKKGEIIGIIGKNGSGKSTLLKILSGIIQPTFGKFKIDGKISAILELGAGFNPELNGLENIKIANIFNNNKIDQNLNDKIINFADIGDFINQPIKKYSSGMQARLAFAIAIHTDPDILIIDEVLSVGDASFQRKCFSKIEEIKQRGKTIIYVSHNEESILNLCNKVLWLDSGSLILYEQPKLALSLYLKYLNQSINKLKISEECKILKNEQLIYKEIKNPYKDKKKNQLNYEGYNSDFQPKNIIKYKSTNIEIKNPKILQLDKKTEVNIIQSGSEYFFSYDVNVTKPLKKVRFGFFLKKVDGQGVCGENYPSRFSEISILKQNTKVWFKIKMDIAEGIYFFNAGVTSQINDKTEYADRLVDCYMIKVINSPKGMTGLVNLVKDKFII